MNAKTTFRLGSAAILLAIILAVAPAASAQCAMCANAAAAQQAEARKALNLGILMLVAPTFLLIGGIVVLSYQRRNTPGDPADELSSTDELALAKGQVVELSLEESSDRAGPRN